MVSYSELNEFCIKWLNRKIRVVGYSAMRYNRSLHSQERLKLINFVFVEFYWLVSVKLRLDFIRESTENLFT